MNLPALAPTWLFLALLAFLAAGALEDFIRLRISNLTCAAIALLAIIAMFAVGPDWSLWQNVVVFAAILALGTVAFGAGIMGGGDVKFFAAVGLWVPMKMAMLLIATVFLAGGAIALAAILFRLFRRTGMPNLSSAKSRQIPYGIAIAMGAALVFCLGRIS